MWSYEYEREKLCNECRLLAVGMQERGQDPEPMHAMNPPYIMYILQKTKVLLASRID